MVNRVDNNNYTNAYKTSRRVTSATGENELPKFMLDYDEKGVVWDRGDKNTVEKNAPVSEKKLEPRDEIFLSSRADDVSDADKKKEPAGEIKTTSIFSGIKNFFKRIFRFVWYGDEKKEEAVGTKVENVKEKQDYSKISSEDKDSLIREMIKNKDTDGVMDVLTNHRQNMPARCTTMLTYYDRHGQIVGNTGTNENRILKGDRNTISM